MARATAWEGEGRIGDWHRFGRMDVGVSGRPVLPCPRRYPNHVAQVVAIGALPEASASFNRRRDEFWNTYASTGRKAADEKNRASLTRDSLAKLTPGDAFIAKIGRASCRERV